MAKAKVSTTKDSTTKDSTLLVLVVDRSGSMANIKSDMEGGIAQLLADQRALPGECHVTITQFDDQFEVVCDFLPIRDVPTYHLVPRSRTALLDAMGRTMALVGEGLSRLKEPARPTRVVFAVITDGLENASREWDRSRVMAEVKRLGDEEGWQFTFLGANQDAIHEGGSLGMSAAASLTYEPSSAGVGEAFASVSRATARYRSGKASALSYEEEERRRASGES
jgi:hypothetical protein